MLDKDNVIKILLRHKDMYFGDKAYDGIHFSLEDVANMLKEQQKAIEELYDLLDENCKDFRQATGGDDVCGLCHYDGCAYKGEEDWCGWCPGFDSDECFVMSNKIRKLAGKELLPDVGDVSGWH